MLYDDELERKKRSRIILAGSRKKVKHAGNEFQRITKKKTEQCYYTDQRHNIYNITIFMHIMMSSATHVFMQYYYIHNS